MNSLNARNCETKSEMVTKNIPCLTIAIFSDEVVKMDFLIPYLDTSLLLSLGMYVSKDR